MRRLILAVLIISVLLFGACSAPSTPARISTPAPAPTSELELYEAYKAIETRLDGMAMNSEAQRYLADFSDLTEGMWQINYVQEYKGYYVQIQQLTDSNPNTYYYKSYWRDAMWYLDSDGHISPDANARRIEADLFDLSAGGFIEPNPNFAPEAELIIPSPVPVPTTTPEPAHTPPTALTLDPWPWFHSSLSSLDITREPLRYDGRGIVISGQTYLEGSGPRLLVDGKSGVNIAGHTASLQRGFYRLMGEYDADTNTLNVTGFDWEQAKYLAIEAGKELDINLVPVSVQGLIATTPKEVASMLASYISIPHFPKDIPIYPYVVYTKGGFYLALSDTLVHLPSEFTFLYEGKDYGFTFSAGEVKGTLVKTPLKEINFGPKWEPDEFGGVIIANSLREFTPLNTTVEEINAEPEKYAFQRVSITASYIVTTATLDYSDIKAPMGQGVLAETFTDFFVEGSAKRLETIDPEARAWQLRECQVTGTVIYPTEEILKYLDYSAPLSRSEVIERLKPVLIVDALVDDEVELVNISELNPTVGDPSRYWGKVVQFEGYALGINYPLKTLVKTVTARDIPLNVNLLAVGIADSWLIGSQLAIIGLNNDLIDEQGEIIKGKYKFRVAVTHMPEELVSGVPGADTAFFLLSKEELPMEIPKTELYSLNISINPSGAGSVVLTPPGVSYPSGTLVTLTALPTIGYAFDHWSGDASSTSASIVITVDAAKSVTAHFRRIL